MYFNKQLTLTQYECDVLKDLLTFNNLCRDKCYCGHDERPCDTSMEDGGRCRLQQAMSNIRGKLADGDYCMLGLDLAKETYDTTSYDQDCSTRKEDER